MVDKYLQKCIDSICAQTYTKLEIILIDDGSPDCCGDICDKNALKDARIMVIHKENGGLSSARNMGLDIAKGEYIAFIDADDMIHPRFIEILTGLCEQYDSDIAQCDYLAVTEDFEKINLNSLRSKVFYNGKEALHNLCCEKNPTKYTIVCNKVYKRKLFENVRFPYGKCYEDEFITYLIFWNVQKMVDINQYLYYYLQRKTSIMGQQIPAKWPDAIEAFKGRLNFLKKHGLEKEYFCTLRGLYYRIDNYCRMIQEGVENYGEIYGRLLKEKDDMIKRIPQILDEDTEEFLSYHQITQLSSYPAETRIVLYGAGKWGRICYKWIREHQHGDVVGWVDNIWNTIKDIDYPITSLDSLLDITCDLVLVTIKSKCVREGVKNDLMCWGVPEDKICLIFTEDV